MIRFVILGLCAIQLFAPEVSSAFNYQNCPADWIKKGCRIDDDRGLTTLFDDRRDSKVKIDWDNLYTYIKDLACRCRAKAMAMNFEWFALENYGICFSGAGALNKRLENHPLDKEHNCVGAMKLNKSIVSDVDGEMCVGGNMRAYFYEMTKSGSPIGEKGGGGEGEATAEPPAVCEKVSDVVLLIDVSGSVGEDNFKSVKEFLQEFVKRYDFTKGQSRLAIVTFDEDVYVELTWKDSQVVGVPKIREIVDNLKYTGGSTITDKALNRVLNVIIKPNKRSGIDPTVYIMTDGKTWGGKDRLTKPSLDLKNEKCTMVVIGVGDEVDPVELGVMATKPDYIFLLKSFKNLIEHAAKHLNSLIKKGCPP